jgi:TolA-binding protein
MMTHDPSDVDSISRWRDRAPGGSADEDRAAALTRAVVTVDSFASGLDDRQLLTIAERLDSTSQRRARPPFWLRAALVAALLMISLASAIGYERGWLAPLRERLRFRAIPASVRAPSEQPKRHAAHPEATPHGDQSTAREEPPPPEAASVAAAASPAAPPVPLRAPVATSAIALPARKVAVAVTRRPAAPASGGHEPAPASDEIPALERAIGLLRGKHDAPAALAALEDYIARFPSGVLVREASVARIDALLMLDRADEALRALDALPLDAHRRSTELRLIRAELRARTDCGRADADFTAVLAHVRTAALEERALYGRAACRSNAKDAGAADDLRRYVDRFPNGAHADWARRWLENNH